MIVVNKTTQNKKFHSSQTEKSSFLLSNPLRKSHIFPNRNNTSKNSKKEKLKNGNTIIEAQIRLR